MAQYFASKLAQPVVTEVEVLEAAALEHRGGNDGRYGISDLVAREVEGFEGAVELY